MKLIEKLAGNTFFLFLDWFFVTLFSFVFWVIVWKSLPPESAGIIATSLNFILLISTIGIFGLHATIGKLISEYAKGRTQNKIKYLISFSTRLIILINLVIAIVFFASVALIPIDLKLPMLAIAAIAIGIFIWPIVQETTSILYGFQNMKRIYKTDLHSSIIKVVATAFLVYIGLDYFGPLVALIVASLALILFRRNVLIIRKSVGTFLDKKRIIFKYALPAFAASIAWAFYVNTPTIILTLLDTLRSTGIFAAALSIVNPLAFIPTIIAQALFPLVSGLMVIKHHATKQAEMIRSVLRYVVFLTTPLLIIYIFFAKAFVLVFAQLQYLDAVQYIPIIGIVALLQGTGHIFLQSLFAIRKTEANRNVSVATAISFLIFAIPLTAFFGINGLIAAFVISVFVFISLGYAVLRKYLKFSLPWDAISRIAVASVIFFFVLYLPEALGFKLLQKLPFLFIGLFLYFAILLKIKFYTQQDIVLLRFASKKSVVMKKQFNQLANFLEKYLNSGKSETNL